MLDSIYHKAKKDLKSHSVVKGSRFCHLLRNVTCIMDVITLRS